MRPSVVLAALLLIFVCLNGCIGARILVLLPLGSKSHKFAAMPIVEALAERGHELLVFSGFKPTKEIENVKEYHIGGLDVLMAAFEETEKGAAFDWFEMHKKDAIESLKEMMDSTPDLLRFIYDDMMNMTDFRTVLEERNVDLVIVDAIMSEITYPAIEQLGVPFIFHCSSGNLPWSLELIRYLGGDVDYASVPYPMSGSVVPMGFWQRLMNLRLGLTFQSIRNKSVFSILDDHVKKDFPNARPVEDMIKEVSLVLVNSHPITDFPRALPPSVIPIGAPHTRPAKSLPPPFGSFADGATDGLIVFTLGSLVEMTKMPKHIYTAFIGAFSKLPQRVIMKWEGEVPHDLPANIQMSKWLPQQDIIGHPNTKLFIAHCGMLGTQETIYHGVPVLGLPFSKEHTGNIDVAIRGGYGLSLDWDKVTEPILLQSISRLINEPSFQINAKKASYLMRDELVPGRNVAVYWVEHVLRHGGTKHLQLASKNVRFYQRYLLDIILFFVAITVILLLTLVGVVRLLVCKCFLRNSSAKTKVN